MGKCTLAAWHKQMLIILLPTVIQKDLTEYPVSSLTNKTSITVTTIHAQSPQHTSSLLLNMDGRYVLWPLTVVIKRSQKTHECTMPCIPFLKGNYVILKLYTGYTQTNGAVSILNTIETAPFFCVCPVYSYNHSHNRSHVIFPMDFSLCCIYYKVVTNHHQHNYLFT
jgi:hypothetical protein